MNVCLAVFTTTVAILALGLLIYVLITNNVHAAASVTKDVEKPHNNLIYKPKSGDEVIDIEKEGLPRMRSERSLKPNALTKCATEARLLVHHTRNISSMKYHSPSTSRPSKSKPHPESSKLNTTTPSKIPKNPSTQKSPSQNPQLHLNRPPRSNLRS
ncbi:hypothetical protein L596_029089 [Steinernema carpocapsae]|uniref:Uncharacterized protein n=1 Tax=Steinernema carpocapsae TaxID=34508 RepID=A0A4U5LTL0_STECR|nr:hypothetical protein L596_029089 [Steinernema carpocapsae]